MNNSLTKVCGECKKDLPIAEFYARPERLGRPKSSCKECHKAAMREYRRAHPEKTRRSLWAQNTGRNSTSPKTLEELQMRQRKEGLKRFGLTIAQFIEMRDKQSNNCLICGRGPSSYRCLGVDHDHATGRVRGLLCGKCNAGLGNFEDNREYLSRAIEYLSK